MGYLLRFFQPIIGGVSMIDKEELYNEKKMIEDSLRTFTSPLRANYNGEFIKNLWDRLLAINHKLDIIASMEATAKQ